MITDSVLDAQMIRIGILRNRPAIEDDVRIAYQESARNNEHAVRITSHILRYSEFFPTPSEVYNAAAITLQEGDIPKRSRNCPLCDGTEYEQVWQLVTYHRTAGGGVYKALDTITNRETAMDLKKRVDGKDQLLYDCVRPCPRCRPVTVAPVQPEPEKKPARNRGMRKLDPSDSGGLLQ